VEFGVEVKVVGGRRQPWGEEEDVVVGRPIPVSLHISVSLLTHKVSNRGTRCCTGVLCGDLVHHCML
jgi:hypothetical protein